MASETPKSYRNLNIYSVFVRNHSPEGNFEGVIKDLDRIQSLGTDVIWLMPIHPIGKQNRKGTKGSPYAIEDYLAVNPEYGTLDDLKKLVDEIHKRGMKCIIDVVYNHTSPDSVLVKEHPEWFYRNEEGNFGNRVADWYDIIDLDYNNKDLWQNQINNLKYWAGIVDGFRCDVAPMLPLEFWKEARKQVKEVNQDTIWLSESVEPEFLAFLRKSGVNALSDSEIFQAFDMAYEYDTYPLLKQYLQGNLPLERYAQAVNQQEILFPENYVKLRYLENHDQDRIASLAANMNALENLSALLYFQKGATMIYGGQEAAIDHKPDLFEKDPVTWESKEDLSPLLKKLSKISKSDLLQDSFYTLEALNDEVLKATHEKGDKKMIGFFTLRGNSLSVPAGISDGVYTDLITDQPVEVINGEIHTQRKPIILEANGL